MSHLEELRNTTELPLYETEKFKKKGWNKCSLHV